MHPFSEALNRLLPFMDSAHTYGMRYSPRP
jgi:hypothetical protein